MVIDLQKFRATFLEEAAEHLSTVEEVLLLLERREEATPELLDRIFRAVHSVKGSCGIFGFHGAGGFAHEMETVLDGLRTGRVPMAPDLVDLLLRSGDHLSTLLASASADQALEIDEGLLRALRSFLPVEARASGSAEVGDHRTLPLPGPSLYQVTVRPGPGLLRMGLDPLLLVRDLAEVGVVVSVEVGLDKLPPLAELEHDRCYLWWSLLLRTDRGEDAIREVFLFAEDHCQLGITALGADAREPSEGAGTAPRGAERASDPDRTEGNGRATATLRVPTEKVDDLVNLVGELIISQAMAQQVLSELSPRNVHLLHEAMDGLQRNVRDLQDRVLSIRMVPLGDLFSRFPRVVRDLAAARDKQIDLFIEGEETELDKGMVERIADPLTHLIRNALDHGVEPASRRVAAGKPPRARVRLSAAAEAGTVVIEVADDGAGLDREAILARAVASGLVPAEASLQGADVDALIFHPGLSTAETVTDISGRGVGMDVVRRNVESLGGAVSVHSERGLGTTFRIRLPLTLAILDGMHIRVGNQVYVLPLHGVVESLRPVPGEVETILGRGEVARVRERTLPLLRLDRELGIPDAIQDPTRGLLTVVEEKGRRFALLCDEVVGQSQIVVKSVESNYRRVDGILGATILGDGQVALILDLAALATQALDTQRQAVPALA